MYLSFQFTNKISFENSNLRMINRYYDAFKVNISNGRPIPSFSSKAWKEMTYL